MKNCLPFLAVCILLLSCGQTDTRNPKVKIVTTYGNIIVQLYDETPLHRDNFLKLVDDKAYDSMLFHRVINEFMIQAGAPDSKQAQPGVAIGKNSIGDNIDAEIIAGLFHKKGALAAAREGDESNPNRRSSGSQFYIVQGVTYTPESLETRVGKINQNRKDAIFAMLHKQRQNEIDSLRQTGNDEDAEIIIGQIIAAADSISSRDLLTLTPEQIEAYTTIGGSPHLDGMYTVFGEVIKGLDVVDRIAATKTDINNRPLNDVRIIRMVRK